MGTTLRHLAKVVLAIAALAVVAVVPAAPAAAQTSDWDLIAPQLECVTVNGDGTYTALFGTSNHTGWSLWVPNGGLNHVTPANLRVSPPEWIEPGRQVGVFTVTQQVGRPINYKLGITSVHASSDSVPCTNAPQVAEAPLVVGLLAVAGMVAAVGYRRLGIATASA